MDNWTIIIWILVGVAGSGLLMGYVLYPLLLALFASSKKPVYPDAIDRSVTLVITAWDENELSKKIENSRSLVRTGIDLKILVITNEPSPPDLSSEIDWVVESTRQGKASSLNRALSLVHTPLVVFTDANTMLTSNSLLHLLRPFSDTSIGAVAGEKRVQGIGVHGAGEERYWKYESRIKRSDTNWHSVIAGAGELFAMRTDLFEPLPADCLLDDLELSWQVVRKGYRIGYAPEAVATELPSLHIREEYKRKVRMAAGAYQFLNRHPMRSLFSVSGAYGSQFLFRKWFRWVLAPVFLLLMIGGNVALILEGPSELTWYLTGLQGGFYLLALMGWMLQGKSMRPVWLELPFYFVFMHYCQIQGWFRYRFGEQSALWEKSVRLPVK